MLSTSVKQSRPGATFVASLKNTRSKRLQQTKSLFSGRIVSASEISASFGRQFQTSADGTYAFATYCNFPGDNTKGCRGGDLNGTSIDYCARACEDQRDLCDHFVYLTGVCWLKKNPFDGVYSPFLTVNSPFLFQ